MKLYDCKINLGGQIIHFVPKGKITAAEVTLLREIHGHDNVREIELAGDDRRSHRLEREALERRYDVEGKPHIAATFRRLFGTSGKLPDAIEVEVDEDEDLGADEGDEIGEASEPVKTEVKPGTLTLKGATKAA